MTGPRKLGAMQAHVEVGPVAVQWAEVVTSGAEAVSTLTKRTRAILEATIVEKIVAKDNIVRFVV